MIGSREIAKIPRDAIDPMVIINNSVFRRFKRQSVTINAVKLTGQAIKMHFFVGSCLQSKCLKIVCLICRKENKSQLQRCFSGGSCGTSTYPIYFLCLLTGTKYSSYESSFVAPISTSPSFFAGKSLLLCLPFVAVGFFALLLLLIFINSKLTASVGRNEKRKEKC